MPGVVACVANPHELVNRTKKKTDLEDALFLAREILRKPVEELPLVSIPTDQEMDDRDAVGHHHELGQSHTRVGNRLQALFMDKGFPEVGRRFALHTGEGRKQAIEACFGQDRRFAGAKRIAKSLARELIQIEQLQDKARKEVAKIVERNPEMATILGSIPGVGMHTIASFIAYVGDIGRFPGPKQLAAYCGLVPRVNQSGQRDAPRKISKEGQQVLRKCLVESAYALGRTKTNCPLKLKYQQMRTRVGTRKAVVAIARKLVELMYAMLKNRTLFTSTDPGQQAGLDAYLRRKVLVGCHRFSITRKNCSNYMRLEENTKLLHENELGVIYLPQKGG
jgi:transposase